MAGTFVGEQGSADQQRSDDLIFDFGMNYCEDTDFYLKKGFRVVAFDANPLACGDAERRYAREIATGQLTVVNRAIARTGESLTFYLNTTEQARSTASIRSRDFFSARGEKFEEIEVLGLMPRDLIAQYGIPHYAKIDLDGSDLICLEAFVIAPVRPRYLSVEVDFYTSDQLLDRLQGMGYQRFALIGQRSVPTQTPPLKASEGCYVDFQFAHGCSGLFGRELPTEWIDHDAVTQKISGVIWQYRFLGLLGRFAKLGAPTAMVEAARKRLPLADDWYDLHAALDPTPTP